MTKHAWEETLEEYLGYSGLMDNPKNLKGVERDGLKFVMSLNEDWKSGRFDERMAKQKHETFMIGDDKSYEMMFWGNMSWLIFKDDEIIGAAHSAFPYVSPNHRGRGIMSDIFVIGDEKGRHGKYVYSIGGFNARMEAHRKHVERALERGDAIPENVMQDYEYGDYGLVRTKEYDFSVHKRACEEKAWKRRQEEYSELQKSYSHNFINLSKNKQGQASYHERATGMEFLKKMRWSTEGSCFSIICVRRSSHVFEDDFHHPKCFIKAKGDYYDIHGKMNKEKAEELIILHAGEIGSDEVLDEICFEEEGEFMDFVRKHTHYSLGDIDDEIVNEVVDKATDLIGEMSVSYDDTPSL